MPARIIASQARHELHSSSAPKRLLQFFRARRATCPFLLLLAPSIGHTHNKQHTHKDTHTHIHRHSRFVCSVSSAARVLFFGIEHEHNLNSSVCVCVCVWEVGVLSVCRCVHGLIHTAPVGLGLWHYYCGTVCCIINALGCCLRCCNFCPTLNWRTS